MEGAGPQQPAGGDGSAPPVLEGRRPQYDVGEGPAAVAAVSAGRQRRVAPMPVKVPAEGRVEVEDLVRCQDYDYEETTARAMFGLCTETAYFWHRCNGRTWFKQIIFK